MQKNRIHTAKRKTALDVAKEKASALIVKALDRGCAIWTKPWAYTSGEHGFCGRPYRGINILLTAVEQFVMGYESTAWLSFGKLQQLQKKHPEIRLKEGSKAIEISYWMTLERKDEDGNIILDRNGNPETIRKPRFYYVWNADCFENLIADDFERDGMMPPHALLSLEEKEKRLLSLYPGAPEVSHDGLGRAYYSVGSDKIHLPKWKDFIDEAHAYSTLCHELIHSTGAEGRLKRKVANEFGSDAYSYEELVAEIGAAILSAEAGYIEETAENSAAYLRGWSERLTDNPSWFWDAFSDAKKAADLVLGKEYAKEKLAEIADEADTDAISA